MPSLDTLMSYHRLKKGPLDDSEIFSSVKDLMNYCTNGACYNGQRVAVDNGNFIVEYVIRNNIPIIDMKGSEPIFKSGFNFSEDSNTSYGLLAFEGKASNIINSNNFIFDEDNLNILSQLEIFADDEENIKFAINVGSDTTYINQSTAITIDEIIQLLSNELTNIADLSVKIYVKAQDYYNALNN